ncbi:hypothetical protein B0H11DRAFT_2200162 [Mycena galericulata]|nr:hypothetical protein B0H11DRAFT_2200162 [Mycena galericulata]
MDALSNSKSAGPSPAMDRSTMRMNQLQNGVVAVIPELEEKDSRGYDDAEDVEYILDLGSGVAESACPTPTPSVPKRPVPYRAFRPPRSGSTQKATEREAERDCGICFERAVSPVRTRCCVHLFCAEHIAQWLDGPSADGRCPSCRAPSVAAGLLALGHPAALKAHLVPRTPPPSRAPSPPPLDLALVSSKLSPTSYAAYPLTPARLPLPLPPPPPLPSASAFPPFPFSSPAPSTAPPSASASASSSPSPPSSPPSSSEEEEDSTDYSLPALVRARALQTRRHAPHPLSSVLGVRGALVRVVRVGGWVLVVAVLAVRWGRMWEGEAAGGDAGWEGGDTGAGWDDGGRWAPGEGAGAWGR